MILWCQCVILTEYKDNYAKRRGSLWQCCRDEPSDNTTDSESFKFKSKLTNNTSNAGTANVQVAVSLEYLSSLCKLLKYC